jgi:hypothetical protein
VLGTPEEPPPIIFVATLEATPNHRPPSFFRRWTEVRAVIQPHACDSCTGLLPRHGLIAWKHAFLVTKFTGKDESAIPKKEGRHLGRISLRQILIPTILFRACLADWGTLK